ncbi:MAG: hypothetical protein MJB14_06985, partial [Spirochaetes bacterium]|nr:hypothetical protein [Spirochaetota bacterium]
MFLADNCPGGTNGIDAGFSNPDYDPYINSDATWYDFGRGVDLHLDNKDSERFKELENNYNKLSQKEKYESDSNSIHRLENMLSDKEAIERYKYECESLITDPNSHPGYDSDGFVKSTNPFDLYDELKNEHGKQYSDYIKGNSMSYIKKIGTNELKEMLFYYIENNGKILGKIFFKAHINEIKKDLEDESLNINKFIDDNIQTYCKERLKSENIIKEKGIKFKYSDENRSKNKFDEIKINIILFLNIFIFILIVLYLNNIEILQLSKIYYDIND